jgi:hypothetical protein
MLPGRNGRSVIPVITGIFGIGGLGVRNRGRTGFRVVSVATQCRGYFLKASHRPELVGPLFWVVFRNQSNHPFYLMPIAEYPR